MDARPARRATILFGCVLAMIGAVIGWWWVLNLRTAATEKSQKTAWMGAEAQLAQRLVARSAKPEADRQWLAEHYPHLSISCEAKEPSRGCDVEVAPEQIEALSGRFAARVRMFVGEGATLVVLLALGATLVLRAMVREVQMLRQQGNFLAAVTHELKSPLATIRLYVETLRRRKLSAERAGEYLVTLDEETRRLESLVNHVLLASRLSLAPHRADQQSRPDAVDLVATTEEALAAAPPGQALVWSPPRQPIWARIERTDWLTICRNLFDNARKYGQGAAPARVSLVGTARGLAMLSVADDGLGLNKADLKRVFDRFFRVGDELVRNHEGSGLGLYLVSALAKAAGGKVWVESLGLGRGATFFVVLPLAPHTAAQTQDKPSSQPAWDQAESRCS